LHISAKYDYCSILFEGTVRCRFNRVCLFLSQLELSLQLSSLQQSSLSLLLLLSLRVVVAAGW